MSNKKSITKALLIIGLAGSSIILNSCTTGCNNKSAEKNNDSEVVSSNHENNSDSNDKIKKAPIAKLKARKDISPYVGAWVETVPGQEYELQGFILKEDGSAKSINMATLKYKNWKVDSNKITFIVESIGNHTSSTNKATYSIERMNGKVLVLKSGEYTITMKRDNSFLKK